MATAIYNCKRCKVGRRVAYSAGRESNGYRSWPYRIDDRGARQFPGGDPLGMCPSCARPMQYGMLTATVREEVKCDARCTGARGHSCDCSCGGRNHGSGWSQLGQPISTLLRGAA
jgi:hypothetical protein